MSTQHAAQAQALHQEELLAKSNVVGVGVGYKESNGVETGEVAVVVLVEQKKPLAALQPWDTIPREVDGLRTDVMEVGYLRADSSARERYRPIIPSGVSVGHYKVTAGTLGTLVKDRRTGAMFLLSNNHVFANCNDAQLGDSILQPAAMDGGLLNDDVVAKLERYIRLAYIGDPVGDMSLVQPPPSTNIGGTPTPIPPTPNPDLPPIPPGDDTPPIPVTPRPTVPTPNPRPPVGEPIFNTPTQSGCLNTVVSIINAIAGLIGSGQRVTTQSVTAYVAAQAAIVSPILVARAQDAVAYDNRCDCALARPLDPAMFSDDIRQIGIVNETKPVALGMRIRKYGRTTEYTEGNIKLLNATVNVGYSTTTGNKTARFIGQVIADGMSQGGDSGSLLVDAAENKAVGLLFAGSNLATIFTPMQVVLDALQVDL